MTRINDSKATTTLKAAVLASLFLLFAAAPGFSQQVINLTAGPNTTTMPDGTVVPMWGYNCGVAVAGSTATCGPLSGSKSAAATGALGGINVVNGGSGYTTAPSVTITPATGNTPTTAAVATAVVNGGQVVGFVLTNPGAGYTAAPTVALTGGGGTGATAAAGPAWSPVEITVPYVAGGATSLTINLTNNLSFPTAVAGTVNSVPTSIVIVGQVGGGLGASPTGTPSPNHANAQGCPTWFIATLAPGVPCTSPLAGASGTPPVQGPRVQSMATEVPAVAAGTVASTTITWASLKPGTYLLESGTHPSIQVPMGLIGMLVVTTAPSPAAGTTAATTGIAYPAVAATTKTPAIPAVTYNAEVPAEFSEIDPVQNKQTDQAVRTSGFSETAVWTKMNTGAITALTFSPGSGYTSAPTVSFSGGCAAGATCGGAAATATLGYGVASVTPSIPAGAVGSGSGYSSAPTVTFTGGSGAGAAATATLATSGGVKSVSISPGGSGYTTPTVTLTAPTCTPVAPGTACAGATATATVTAGVITAITVTAAGSGYTAAPTVTITDPAATATGAAATAILGFPVATVAVTNGGAYTSAPTVGFTGGGGAGAAATATLSTSSILSVTLTNGGGGFTSAPTVSISGGGGTGAAATASITAGSCGTAHTCYPPAVNYTPFYYLINGVAFSKSTPAASLFAATAGSTTTTTTTGTVTTTTTTPVTTGITGTVLVRLVNAGLRMHVPSIVNSLTQGFSGAGAASTVGGFTLIAEDGNTLPDLGLSTTSGTVTTTSTAPRVQTVVFMAAGKTYDVMVNVPATPTGATAPSALPIYDRELSLSANSSTRDAGMTAYISVNNATLPVAAGSGVFATAVANPDTYAGVTPCATGSTSCTPLDVKDPAKGVIANDVNVIGVQLLTAPANGTLTCNAQFQNPVPGICANGTFTYTPNAGSAGSDSFTYYGNGNTALTATVTLSPSTLSASTITCVATTYTAKTASYLKIAPPGLLTTCSDSNNLPLTVVTTAPPAGVTLDSAGGFTVLNPTPSTTASTTFALNYTVQNSHGNTGTGSASVTFPVPSNLQVKVLDAQQYNACGGDPTCISTVTQITDYRWILEEDKTFWVDPSCTTNTSITTPGCPAVVGTGAAAGQSTIPTFGVNFHTSTMDFVAQGCTGPLSCEGGQTMLCGVAGAPACPTGTPAGSHIPAVCDVGAGACRPDPNCTALPCLASGGTTPVNPSQAHLDLAKRYYLSVLPGDAANPFPANINAPSNCAAGPVSGSGTSATLNTGCGHSMTGAPVPPACNILGGPNACTTTSAFAPVTVLALPTPLPTGKLSVIVFEDDFPLNGEQDGGGGNGTIAPTEPGLGGFNLVLWDTYGGLGDVTGQDTYDMFNMPLSNSLAGTVDPSTGLDACPVSATPLAGPTNTAVNAATAPPSGGITGMIVTCPKYESDGHTLSPLAGQAVIDHLMPEKFSVQAYPGADRIARGEQWVQTNTLDGQHPHDSFIRVGEPSYFQEYGPAGYHVAIGFANPAIINARAQNVCAGLGTPGAVGPCTNTIDGQVDVQRLSRTPDQRLYSSGTRDALAWTQCWVSLGDPDGEDFMFTFCDAQGNFKFANVPGGEWRLTIGDQWNDQIIDGLSTPVNVGCSAPNANLGTCTGGNAVHVGNLGVQQWQSNLYTTTFIDDNKNGIPDSGEIGIPLIYTMVHFRDGHNSNSLVTDFNGVANFNETYPLFNWYVVEADSTRYKTTGIHTAYDAGGPADGSPSCGTANGARACGTSTAYNYLANTFEAVPLPADLSVPGAVYCAKADCVAEAAGFAAGTPKPSFAGASTGRIDSPWVAMGMTAWAGLTGQSNYVDIGKAPYAECPPACVAVPNAVSNPTGGTTASTMQVGENGGIHGYVGYASTRPFDSASEMIQQPWEPNVPRVTLNLYKEGFAADGVTPTLTLVDRTQSTSWDDWAQGFYPNSTAGSGAGAGMKPYMNCPGQGTNVAGSPNQDLFYFTLFDQPNYLDWYNGIHGTPQTAPHTLPYNSQYKCYDSMHIGNQLQPAPYDGRYFFPSVLGINPTTGKPNTALTGGVGGNGPGTTGYTAASMPGTNCTICVANPDSTDHWRVGTPMLPPGKYVVQVVMPPGYEVYKEEDKNLLIGDNFIAPVTQQFAGLGGTIFIIPDQASVASMYDPSAAGYNPNNFQNQTTALGLNEELSGVPGFPGFQDPLWPCVGEQRVVPDYLSLFPHAQEVAPFAGATRPLCDRKEVTLNDVRSVTTDFYIFTSTHIASKYTGNITDDYTSEFDPFSPQFGEKFSPPNLPVSTKDYLGNELSRVYSDHWGTYDGLTFSSWEVNPPNITGYSPTLMVQCMNDPGPILDTRSTIANPRAGQTGQPATIPNPTYGRMIPDPLYNPAYSDFCYEQPFMPGLTLYADTPVVPTQADVGAGYNNPDCSYPDATPAIAEVDGAGIGPWVASAGATLTITALGDQQVQNESYSGPSARVAPFNMKTITRHYGFGTTQGSGSVTIGGRPAGIVSWGDAQIVVAVPTGVPNCAIQQQAQYGGSTAQCGQLLITAGNGKQSIDTVTVTIGGKAPTPVAASDSIQAAIDAAAPGDMLMIYPDCTSATLNAAGGLVSTPIACTTAITTSTVACTATSTTTCTKASAASHSEMLLMWKPVRLQGVGAASSIIDAGVFPAGKALNPWRRHVNCLFGLTLQGVPYTAAGGAAPYDPSGTYQCPDNGWAYFTAQPNAPQIDRLPLEATVGWDATQNGNLAEQLQEPSLMGAYEGAGITVLGKGLDFHGLNPWNDGNEGGAFPLGTTLLTGVGANPLALPVGDANSLCTDGASGANRFPSNFMCNPSSIDGLTIRDSSQGGGGIFAHGWAHHLQIANNRVYNNAGTLSGGISVGQGEFPTPYVVGSTTNAAPGSCSDGTGWVYNQHMPYCLELQVNVHNNYVTNNSSLGDELFSGTLSGGGGVTFCTGNDYYLFAFNWVCGNLSSGEGGGVVHLGEIQNGDIEHNSIAFNQSDNPTIPTNGGGIMVAGTPDTDPVCGTQIDSDCPPGLSDGIGHNLVINANLIQGNMAESGAGGGIRLQQVNGTDVSTFPGVYPITAANEGRTVTVGVPATAIPPRAGDSVTIAGVSVAGYNGTFTVTRVGGCGGGGGARCFTYFGATGGLAPGTGGTFTDTTATTAPLNTAQAITSATETGPGVVTITSTLPAFVGDRVTITGVTPAGYNGTYTVTGIPVAGTFTYSVGAGVNLAAATAFGTVADPNPNLAVALLWNSVNITNNIIVNNVVGWDGAGISLQDSLNVSILHNTIASNDALASSGVLTQSIGTPDASAPAGDCTRGRFSCPQSSGVTSTRNSSVLTTTFTGLTITCPPGHASCTGFSNPILANNVIWQNRSFHIGVGSLGRGTLDQQRVVSLFNGSGATLAPVQTAYGQCVAGVSYWDIGVRGDTGPGNHSSGFTLNPTYSVLDDPGYTSGSNSSANPSFVGQYCNGARVPPTCTVADGCGGPSGYGVPPGIADALSPNPIFSLNPAATVDEGNNWINVSWGPLALSNDSVTGGTTGNYGGGALFANYALAAGSPAIEYVPCVNSNAVGQGCQVNPVPGNTSFTITVPTTDFFGNPRPDSGAGGSVKHVDAGAVESQAGGNGSGNGGGGGGTATGTLAFSSATNGTLRTVAGVPTFTFTIPTSRTPVTSVVTISNTGTAPLTITAETITLNIGSLYSVAGTTCSSTTPLAVGGTCTVSIMYATPRVRPVLPDIGSLTVANGGSTASAIMALVAQ